MRNPHEKRRPGRRTPHSHARRMVLLGLMGALALASCSAPGSTLADMKAGHGRHHADTLQLSWNANTEANLAGYRLYTRTASGTYGTPASIGLVTTTNVTTLAPGTVYYFALTALNTAGQESLKTAEISYLAP